MAAGDEARMGHADRDGSRCDRRDQREMAEAGALGIEKSPARIYDICAYRGAPMAAVTIHLPADVEEKVRRASEENGQSVSAWLTEAARRQRGERLPPKTLLDLFGAVS